MKVKALLEFQMHNVTVPFLSADVDAPVVTDPELTRQKFSILTGPQLSKAAPSEAQPQHSDAVPLPLQHHSRLRPSPRSLHHSKVVMSLS